MVSELLDDGRVYKLKKTCRGCERTATLAVWNRLAMELDVSLTIERWGDESTFLCPKCAKLD